VRRTPCVIAPRLNSARGRLALTHRRWPSGKPRLRAFCRSAPAVRFMALTIFECTLSSRTSSFDQGRRLVRLSSFGCHQSLPSRGELGRSLNELVDSNLCRTRTLRGAANLGKAMNSRLIISIPSVYNETRTHLGFGKDVPLRRAIQQSGTIVPALVLFGLHHRYAHSPAQPVLYHCSHPTSPSPTTRRSILLINSALCASAAFMAVVACFKVLVFDPQTTVPPITTAAPQS
jgi:hypothetical protein